MGLDYIFFKHKAYIHTEVENVQILSLSEAYEGSRKTLLYSARKVELGIVQVTERSSNEFILSHIPNRT